MGNVRNIYTKIVTNDDDSTVFETNQILSINIQRSITNGAFGIGYTQSDRLTFTAVAPDKLTRKTRTTVYIRIDDEELKRLGRFYVDECTRDGSTISVVAYDLMYFQDKAHVWFNGKASIGLGALSFPCSMQQMLNYICTLRGFSCDFVCESFTVAKKPLKPDETPFTVRELLGFIAASHGCNAKFDNTGKLVFQPFALSNTEITASDATAFEIDDSEPYKVNGVQFTVDSDTTINIFDGIVSDSIDDDDIGIVRCYNPLATIQIANHVWSRIGNKSYYGGSISLRGTGENNCGDILTVGNLKYPADTETYQLCVTDISYSISADSGFMETLSSQVIKEGGTSNGSVPSGGKSGVGEAVGKYSEIFNVYKTEQKSALSVTRNQIDDGTINDFYGGNKADGSGITLYHDLFSHGGGQNITVSDSQFVEAYGYNIDVQGHSSFVFGNTITIKRFTQWTAQSSIICGQSIFNFDDPSDTVGGYISESAVLGAAIKILSKLTRSIVTGNGITITSADCCSISGIGHNIVDALYCIVGGYGADVDDASLRLVIGNDGNIFTVDSVGNVKAAGSYGTIGADYAEMFEWADGNPENEDRRGLLVALDGDKIIPAHGDEIIGVVSSRPSVVGNAYDLYWHGKYATDVFGKIITTPQGEPLISPDYDPEREYIPRSKRPEWSPVGLVGRLVVIDDGSCTVGSFVSARQGIGTKCFKNTGIRVIGRIDKNHIEVLIK